MSLLDDVVADELVILDEIAEDEERFLDQRSWEGFVLPNMLAELWKEFGRQAFPNKRVQFNLHKVLEDLIELLGLLVEVLPQSIALEADGVF